MISVREPLPGWGILQTCAGEPVNSLSLTGRPGRAAPVTALPGAGTGENVTSWSRPAPGPVRIEKEPVCRSSFWPVSEFVTVTVAPAGTVATPVITAVSA